MLKEIWMRLIGLITILNTMVVYGNQQNTAITGCSNNQNRVMLVIAAESNLPGVQVDAQTFGRFGQTLGAKVEVLRPQDFEDAAYDNEQDRNRANELLSRIRKLQQQNQSSAKVWQQYRAISRKSSAMAFKDMLKKKVEELRRQNPEAEIWTSYAGHGVNCKQEGGDVQWCARVSLQAGEHEQISYSELTDIIRPTGMFLDSCFSGRAANESTLGARENSRGDLNAFLFASTTGLQAARDIGGGVLAGVISQLMNASPEQACKLDLDGDGEISQRELGVSVVGAFYNAATPSRQINSTEPLPMRSAFKKMDDRSFQTMNNNIQVPVSHRVSGQCIARIANPGVCPSAQRQHESPLAQMCPDVGVLVLNLADSQNAIQSAGGMANYFSFLFKPSASTRKSAERGTDSYSVASILSTPAPGPHDISPELQARREEILRASAFLVEWQNELQTKMSSCAGSMPADTYNQSCVQRPLASAQDLLGQVWAVLLHMEFLPQAK